MMKNKMKNVAAITQPDFIFLKRNEHYLSCCKEPSLLIRCEHCGCFRKWLKGWKNLWDMLSLSDLSYLLTWCSWSCSVLGCSLTPQCPDVEAAFPVKTAPNPPGLMWPFPIWSNIQLQQCFFPPHNNPRHVVYLHIFSLRALGCFLTPRPPAAALKCRS